MKPKQPERRQTERSTERERATERERQNEALERVPGRHLGLCWFWIRSDQEDLPILWDQILRWAKPKESRPEAKAQLGRQKITILRSLRSFGLDSIIFH